MMIQSDNISVLNDLQMFLKNVFHVSNSCFLLLDI
jgi:hypothetical protein